MTRYSVVTHEAVTEEISYVVEAENEDHAIQLVLDGEYEDSIVISSIPVGKVPEVVRVEIVD